MKYLDKAPFSSKPATSAYRYGWEKTFGKKAKTLEPHKIVKERVCVHGYRTCDVCLWLNGYPKEIWLKGAG